jgi:predicted HAD superfamily phosphohydrolase YqeG
MTSRLATGSSAFTTLVQVWPRLISLIGRMRPTWQVRSLAEITPAFLRARDVRGLIWDVDGTLTGDGRRDVLPEAAAPFRALLADPDVRHVILSNASEERFRQLGEMFPEIPLLRGYVHRGVRVFRTLHRGVESGTADQLAKRLADGAHVIRKPSAELIHYAVRELRCAREHVVMVGDQYLTDVAGANLGGIRSIKLPTLAPETFRRSVRLGQIVENVLFALVHGRRGHGHG